MILCSGAFDGFHAGHAAYLVAASQLRQAGEVLYCAVAPDSWIRQKGRAPRWSQGDRVRALDAVKWIDAVIPYAEPSLAPLIRELKPRLIVKGKDWEDRLPDDVVAACHAVGCAMAFVDTPGRHVRETEV